MSKKIRDYATGFALLAGFVGTVVGIHFVGLPGYSPHLWDSIPTHVFYILLFAASIEIIARIFRISKTQAAFAGAVLIALIGGAIGGLGIAIWLAAGSFALGRLILRGLGLELEKVSRLTTTLSGAGVLGFVVGLTAHFPINTATFFGLLLTIPMLIEWRAIRGVWSVLVASPTTNSLFDSQKVESPVVVRALPWLDLAIGALALYHFAVSLMPEVGHDALAMHLFIPGHMADRQMWDFNATNYVYAVAPMLGDWLYSIGYVLGGETAARLINVSFVFALCVLIRDFVMWCGGDRLGSRWAILLFLTTPVTFLVTSSLFIETVWAAFALAGVFATFRFLQSQGDAKTELPVAGLLLGAALTSKAITLTILPAIVILLAIRYRHWLRGSAVALTKGFLLFLLVGLPPYVTAFWLTGNPLLPFYNNIFKSDFYPPAIFEPPPMFTKGVAADILYRATFNSVQYIEGHAGAPGFHWILLLVPALFILAFNRRWRALSLFFVAGVAVLIAFNSSAYFRYVFPSFAMLSTFLGVALSSTHLEKGWIGKTMHGFAFSAAILNIIFLLSATNYGAFEPLAILTSAGRTEYLRKVIPLRNAVETVNSLNLDKTPVAVFAPPMVGGLKADALFPNWYNYKFQAVMFEVKSGAELAAHLKSAGVNFVIFDPTWGNEGWRQKVVDATESVHETDSIDVRKVKTSFRYQTELLKNPDFRSFEGWGFSSGVAPSTGGLFESTEREHAYQIIPVSPLGYYRNEAALSCRDPGTSGRLQINWLDSHSELIRTQQKYFECSPTETEHSMIVIAPKNAKTAVIFAVSNTEKPVTFKRMSFKQ